jgi:hypothetical protein
MTRIDRGRPRHALRLGSLHRCRALVTQRSSTQSVFPPPGPTDQENALPRYACRRMSRLNICIMRPAPPPSLSMIDAPITSKPTGVSVSQELKAPADLGRPCSPNDFVDVLIDPTGPRRIELCQGFAARPNWNSVALSIDLGSDPIGQRALQATGWCCLTMPGMSMAESASRGSAAPRQRSPMPKSGSGRTFHPAGAPSLHVDTPQCSIGARCACCCRSRQTRERRALVDQRPMT